eukprot:Rhum_TRINITY_DN14890_c5_g2::Rhum_TRINITY_DN14890_c5_g2_i1::g.126581::m.126581
MHVLCSMCRSLATRGVQQTLLRARSLVRQQLRQHDVQGCAEGVDAALVKHEGRLDLQHVVQRTAHRDDHALLAHQRVDQVRLVPRLLRAAAHDKLHADHQTLSTHAADDRMLLAQLRQLLAEILTRRLRLRHQLLVLHRAQHRRTDRHRDGVARKGGEVVEARGAERVGDLLAAHDGRHRVSVADGLAERHDVGTHVALRLEGPPVRAHTPEADLHLVHDAEGTVRPRVLVALGHPAVGREDLTADAHDGLGPEGGHLRSVLAQLTQLLVEQAGVLLGALLDRHVVLLELSAVRVRSVDDARRLGRRHLALVLELVRREVDARRRVAVVRVVHHHHVLPVRVRRRQAVRKVVRLRARVREEDRVEAQLRRERGQELLRVRDQVVVQEAGVGVQRLHLLDARLHHLRAAVPDVRHVVDCVQVPRAVRRDEVAAHALHDLARKLHRQRARAVPLTEGNDLVLTELRRGPRRLLPCVGLPHLQ